MTFQEQIGLWLANRAATDEEFKKDYSKKNKSLDECVKFIESKLLQKVLEQRKANKDNSEVSVSAPTDDEGIAMCHCVFSCEYYKRKDSVILSIRDKKGKRIETAEVNIKKFYIAQQYGKHDVFSEWHEDIKNFINEHVEVQTSKHGKEGRMTDEQKAIAGIILFITLLLLALL